jgi:hypothetical protein
MFDLDLIELPKLLQINGPKRYYQIPSGKKYPSVTTILSAMSDKSGLDRWRERVGEEEANRKMQQASARGTAVHAFCEKYVLNEPIDMAGEMPLTTRCYNQLKNFVKDNVNNIRSSEGQLYSDTLKTAGSVDLVADYRGLPSIIDFKTSEKEKKEEWIENYFLQTSMYSFMLWERTGLLYPNIVVAIGVDERNEAQIFVRKAKDYLPKAKKMCIEYHERFENE